ncbi:hypothetical protein AO070_02690 [Pseudomonas syringae pv. syringae PD2766]|nr:hypothetical protein AO070_02690 [Pseudomonas syringae pv. syringae PD2766]
MDPATLEFQKAGRAGLILQLDGFSWAPPITRRTFLETFRLDALVTMSDGTNYPYCPILMEYTPAGRLFIHESRSS